MSVPASKLIFEKTPRWASSLLRILQNSELTDEAEGRFGVGLLILLGSMESCGERNFLNKLRALYGINSQATIQGVATETLTKSNALAQYLILLRSFARRDDASEKDCRMVVGLENRQAQEGN